MAQDEPSLPPLPPTLANDRDLGFGAVVAAQHERLLNRDGSFNVRKVGLGFWEGISPYHAVLTMTWGRFVALLAISYLAINLIFAAAFLACGPEALQGDSGLGDDLLGRAGDAFFFSVQTLATIGYGRTTPHGWVANFLVTFEAMIGIFLLALGTGLFYARFAQPSARLRFTHQALIAPFGDGMAFEFRAVNKRRAQLVEVSAKVILARFTGEGKTRKRRFDELSLERSHVTFFPLSWTIVHPIDEKSPLWGLGPADLEKADAEFLVLFSGIDETSATTVHARTSYGFDEIIWNARFSNIFVDSSKGSLVTIDAGQLDRYEKL